MLCAKLPKCDTLFPEDDIKIYDATKSTAVFSRTQSCLYQYLWIYKVSSLEDTFVKEITLKDGFEFSHYIFALYHGVVSPKRRDIRAIWLIENRHGVQWQDEMVPYCMTKSLIKKTVMGTTMTDDDDDKIVVYVKGHEKQEWLRDLLLDEMTGC